jgi:hypothetical protein
MFEAFLRGIHPHCVQLDETSSRASERSSLSIIEAPAPELGQRGIPKIAGLTDRHWRMEPVPANLRRFKIGNPGTQIANRIQWARHDSVINVND